MCAATSAVTTKSTKSRWYRIRRVLSLVDRREGRSVSEVIRTAVTGEPSLLESVIRLAKARSEMGSFLEEPAVAGKAGAPGLGADSLFAGRYRVEAFAGGGAIGEVYRVRDLLTGDLVALKLIRGELQGDSGTIERFRNELSVGRGIVSEHICPLYHFDEAALPSGARVPYFTMEYLDGETLDERLCRGPMGEQEARSIALQMLEGLQAAHANGVIHGDLKCANVFLVKRPGTAERRVVITDFGMARRVRAGMLTESSDLIMGTPAYMPREQIRGQQLTAASDLYAVAVMLYRMSTGELPFAGDSVWETMRLRLEETEPRKPAGHAWKRYGWQRAVREGLRAEPEERPQSVGEFRKLLLMTPPYRRWVLGGAGAIGLAAGALLFLGGGERPLPPEARRAMVLGSEFIDRRGPEDYAKALGEFRKVIAVAPEHAAAWIGLSQAYAGQANWGMAKPREVLPEAQKAARRAVELDAGSARAQAALAYSLSIDVDRWREAEPHFQRALALRAEDAGVLVSYAAHMGRTSRHGEAIELLERARILAPQMLTINHQLAVAYWRARRVDPFLEAAKELVRIQPTLGTAHLTHAKALLAAGRTDEAAAAYLEAERFRTDEPQLLSFRARLCLAQGKRAEAIQLNERLHSLATRRVVDTIVLASVPAALGEAGMAVADLEAGLAAGDSAVLSAHDHPLFDGVASDPRFGAFRQKLGLGTRAGSVGDSGGSR